MILLKKEVLLQRDDHMKNFKQIREKVCSTEISEKNDLNYVVKDSKSADFIRKELSGIVKAEIKVNRKNSKYHLNIIPKTNQDEKIVKSFMDDANIEMLKDNFVKTLNRVSKLNESETVKTFTGEEVVVDSSVCAKIMNIHDNLERENQEIFMEMLVHSAETFEQAKNFCETYAENKE